MHSQPPLPPRHPRLARLGASAHGKRLKRSDPGYTWRDVAAGAGWIGVGAVLLCGVVALSVVGASATLYGLGWLLQTVLVSWWT
jgi:hypothetical protein